MTNELNQRSREIFRQIVDSYLETGDPVGSRTVSRMLDGKLSPATIRNVMSDLEEAGLLFAPHTSAGRLPTESGLRLFVDGLLEIGNISDQERNNIESKMASGITFEGALEEATSAISGLSGATGLVVAPKTRSPLRHIEFVSLSPGRALVVLVTENGVVENRLFDVPEGTAPSALVEATNYLSARLVGRTIAEAYDDIVAELDQHRAALDDLASDVVARGLASWSGGDDAEAGLLIVRGQANLLDDLDGEVDLVRIRALFRTLERKESMLNLLSLAESAAGVQIFIGSSSSLFNVAGCSMIVSPFRNSCERIVGAVGVIGPARMHYARIVPIVDYTARLVARAVNGGVPKSPDKIEADA